MYWCCIQYFEHTEKYEVNLLRFIFRFIFIIFQIRCKFLNSFFYFNLFLQNNDTLKKIILFWQFFNTNYHLTVITLLYLSNFFFVEQWKFPVCMGSGEFSEKFHGWMYAGVTKNISAYECYGNVLAFYMMCDVDVCMCLDVCIYTRNSWMRLTRPTAIRLNQ